MIETIRERFLSVRYPYSDPILRQRAQALLIMNVILVIAWVFFTGFTLVQLLNGTADWLGVGVSVGAPIIFYAIYQNIQQGRAQTSILILLGLLISGASLTAITTNFLFHTFYLLVPLVAAGVLLNRRNFLVVCVILALALAARAFTFSQSNTVIRFVPSVNGIEEFSIGALILTVTGIFLYAFSGTAERLSSLSGQDVRHLKTFNKFNADSAGLDPDNIAQYTIHLLQDDLGYNLVQVYFADETGMVTRRIRSGGLTDTRFNTRIEDLPIIGEAIRARSPRMFKRDASTLTEYPLAPARIGIAVPILYLGVPLGLLDVQSRIPEEPTQDQLDGFGLFGDQLARALMNARKTSDLQRTVEGQEDVIASFRTRLTELQQRSAQVISGGWTHYFEGRGRNAIGFDLEMPEGKASAKAATDLPVDIREAILRGDVHVAQYDDEQIVNVPILLRDETLGAMSFTIPSSRPITDRQVEVLRTVANRLGQALENNRLFEQSQSQARRERKANEVGARLIGATNLESLLDLAAESFNDALGAVYTRIYIEPSVIAEPSAAHTNGYSNGSANGGDGMNGHESSDQAETDEGGLD